MTVTSGKLSVLNRILSESGSAIIACSGGTDSIFLLHMASKVRGLKLMAVTARTSYMHQGEISEAEEFCRERGIEHRVTDIAFPGEIRQNPAERCYLCKKVILSSIIGIAAEEGYDNIFDGTNADDVLDYRPGMKALKESGVRSPLLESGLTKKEIRMVSRSEGLKTWDKPANACLLTRFPHGAFISEEELAKAGEAESFIASIGFPGARVRVHGDMVRIEFRQQQFRKALTAENRKKISEKLKSIGYRYISADIEGYITGKMNIKSK